MPVLRCWAAYLARVLRDLRRGGFSGAKRAGSLPARPGFTLAMRLTLLSFYFCSFTLVVNRSTIEGPP